MSRKGGGISLRNAFEIRLNLYKISVPASQRTNPVIKIGPVIFFSEIIGNYNEDRATHTNTVLKKCRLS